MRLLEKNLGFRTDLREIRKDIVGTKYDRRTTQMFLLTKIKELTGITKFNKVDSNVGR